MSAPASQFALLEALNSVADDEEDEEGKKPEDFRTMQIDQLRNRVVELSEIWSAQRDQGGSDGVGKRE